MKRFFCSLLCLMLLLSAYPAFCEDSEGDLSVDEIVESVDLDTPAAGEWNFPVALEDMNPDFVRLANKHYLLDKDYYAKPLVKDNDEKPTYNKSYRNDRHRLCRDFCILRAAEKDALFERR